MLIRKGDPLPPESQISSMVIFSFSVFVTLSSLVVDPSDANTVSKYIVSSENKKTPCYPYRIVHRKTRRGLKQKSVKYS